MRLLWSIAWKELVNSRAFAVFFIINVVFGLVGFFITAGFRNSIDESIERQAKSFLTADYQISGRRPLSEVELQEILQKAQDLTGVEPQLQKSIEFYTMAQAGDFARLVLVKAVSDNYPFYGEVELEEAGFITGETKRDLSQGLYVWAYPEIFAQFKLSKDQVIKLGDQQFYLKDKVIDDVNTSLSGFAMAPVVYMSLQQAEAGGFIQAGSTITYHYLLKLQSNQDSQTVVKALGTAFPDPSIQFRDAKSVTEQSLRLLMYLGDFMSLSAMVALFLSGVGIAFLVRTYLGRKVKSMAILQSLGLRAERALGLYVLQLVSLVVVGFIFAALLATALRPSFESVLQGIGVSGISISWKLESFLSVLLLGIFGSLFVSWPFMRNILKTDPKQLFAEYVQEEAPLSSAGYLWFIPALVVFWLGAIWQSHSLKIGSLFFVSFIVCLAVLAGLAYLLFKVLGRIQFKNWMLNLAVKEIARKKSIAIGYFSAIGMGLLLIGFLPQLRQGIINELAGATEAANRPELFLFDIQMEQLEEARTMLAQNGYSLEGVSPLVRARLIKVNDKPFERQLTSDGFTTREEESEARMRNRGLNLTYRDKLGRAEEIIEGCFNCPEDRSDQNGPAPISIEQRYAERLNLKMGDVLVFDIQGVDVEGKITSIRRVKWTSFTPNFFVVLGPGVLEDAPQTFLATISSLSETEKINVQNQLAKAFANISVIDISGTVTRVLSVVEKMQAAISLLAILCFISGLLVVASIAHEQVRAKMWDINMLKVFGVESKTLLKKTVAEFFGIGMVACILGSALSLFPVWLMSKVFFDGLFSPTWPVLVLISLVGGTLVALVGAAMAWRVVQIRPMALLSGKQS